MKILGEGKGEGGGGGGIHIFSKILTKFKDNFLVIE